MQLNLYAFLIQNCSILDIWTVSELDLYLKNHSLPWKTKLKKEKLELKETMAEALRTMTVTGQRLLQEPEAVSDDDDDDDEGNNTILGETRSEESESEESECEESENEESESRRVTRVSLSDSQRDLVAQEVGVMHQVSYSSSVSTFCRNEIKDRNYKSVQQHIFISFSCSGKKWLAPTMLNVIFVGNFPQPPLNHCREKE